MFIGLLQLPEMTRDAGERCRWKCLVVDIVGLSLGVVIMTSIAFHEHRIQLLFADQWRHEVTCHDVVVPLRSAVENWVTKGVILTSN